MLLLVLIRECKINKTMLIKVGVPAIVRMLQHHRHAAVSATAVQVRPLPQQPEHLNTPWVSS